MARGWNARVVDEHVDRAESVADGVKAGLDLLGGTEIGRDRERVVTRLLEFGFEAREVVRRAREEGDGVAFRCQTADERFPEPATDASDDCGMGHVAFLFAAPDNSLCAVGESVPFGGVDVA